MGSFTKLIIKRQRGVATQRTPTKYFTYINPLNEPIKVAVSENIPYK